MEIQKILGYLLNASARLIKRRLDEELQKYGITTSQWAVLKLLNSKEELTQAQIAEELKSDRATVGSVILRLSEKNYVEKIAGQKDRRSFTIKLTPQSKAIIEELEAMALKVTDEALCGLSLDEKDTLFKALEQIINNLLEGEANGLEG